MFHSVITDSNYSYSAKQ